MDSGSQEIGAVTTTAAKGATVMSAVTMAVAVTTVVTVTMFGPTHS